MKLTRILFLILLTCSFSSFAQDSKGIKWLSITEAEALMKTEPKKIIVDIYTDWCGWCKQLDASTYKNKELIDYVNKNYYAVKFNAESKDQISYKGKSYSYDPLSRVNGLSSVLMGNSTGYPTTTFIDEKLELLSCIPGYHDAPTMMSVLRYFGENSYLKMDWDAYLSSIQ